MPASPIQLRPATPDDAAICGQIAYDAFATIAQAHAFPPDLPSPEVGAGLMAGMFANPSSWCVVAEAEGRVIGSNCLDEGGVIHGVGPITVDPAAQNRGVGTLLMRAVMERSTERRAAGIRLVQAAFHNRSLSLYTRLGFDIREPLSCLQGRTEQRSVEGCAVRTALLSDLGSCNMLSRQVHGFDRGTELAQAIGHGTAKVVERGGRITGYATNLAFFGHGTAETNTDLQALLASAEVFGGPGLLLPTRNSSLFRWCLNNGLRVVQPMTLMSMGLYNEPAGAWFPSVLY